MKLQQPHRNTVNDLLNAVRCRIDKQADHCDKRGNRPGNLPGTCSSNKSRAVRVKHQAQGIGTSAHYGCGIFNAGNTTNLDAGSFHLGVRLVHSTNVTNPGRQFAAIGDKSVKGRQAAARWYLKMVRVADFYQV